MPVDYSIVYADRKTISIIVERDRSVVVRAPLHASPERIAREIKKREVLLLQKINHPQKYPGAVQAKEFVSGESLLYLGKNYQLWLDEQAGDTIQFDNRFVISPARRAAAPEMFRKWYRRAATELLIPRTEATARQLGLNVKKVNIRDFRYRWGSCTPAHTINLNWRLIKAPMVVIDYIIVHELTHLLESNHSPAFWKRVATTQPGYRQAKTWLKENGQELEVDF